MIGKADDVNPSTSVMPTLPWKFTGIGQGCRRKSYSGNLSLSPGSMNPLKNRKDSPVMGEVTFAKLSFQIVRLIRFSEIFLPDHRIFPTLQ
jgi:hypothetical protein